MSWDPKITIILPVHNRIEKTRLFIDSLLAQTYANYQLVLVDDGSTDGTAEMAASRVPSLTVLRGKGDWWWAGALHQGYLWLRKNQPDPQDLVLIMNDDTSFAPDFLQKAVDLLEGKEKTLLGAAVCDAKAGTSVDPGIHVDWKRFKYYHTHEGWPINCLPTRGLVLRVRDFLDIGGFHPALLPHYLSDYEWTLRAHCKGYCLMTTPDFKLCVDETTTGYQTLLRGVSRWDFFRRYFSRRSVDNPFYLFAFAALACPWPWKGINLLRAVYGGSATVIRKSFGIYNDKWK